MAIVKMKRLHLLALEKDHDRMLHQLQHMGCVEISEPDTTQLPDSLRRCDAALADCLAQQRSLQAAIASLRRLDPKQKTGGLLTPRPQITEKDYLDEADFAAELAAAAEINDLVTELNRLKTGVMISGAAELGCIAAKMPATMRQQALEFADNLGLAFQIRDDILDVTSTEEELGKPIGSDAANEKTTYVTLYGPDRCEELVLEHTRAARQALEQTEWPGDPGFLLWLAEALARRSK